MLKQELIDEVQKEEYKRICKKILPNFWKDLYQELCLTVLEYPAEKVEAIRSKRFFLVGVLLRMGRSSTSPFYKRYRVSYEIKEQVEEVYNKEEDEKIDRLCHHLDKQYWFDKEILKQYLQEGNVRKTMEKTGVSSWIIRQSILKTKKKLKERMNPYKILLICSAEETGLKYHRQLAPHQRLFKTHPEFTYTQIKGGTTQDGKRFEASIDDLTDEILKEFSIVYYLRQISYQQGKVKATIDRLHSLGIKVILDIDDYWKLNPEHVMTKYYKEMGVAKETEEALRLVDAVICTTEHFAEHIRPFNDKVIILPNCVDPDASQFQTRTIESSRVRFGWIGGVYHKNDIAEISTNFCKLAKDKGVRDKYQICLGGYNASFTQDGIVLNKEYDQIERYMSCNYEFRNYDATYTDYLFTYTPVMEHISYDKSYRRLWAKDVYHYGEMYNEIDVALVPLLPNKFNKCKSELKIVEAGHMGKAVIVSDTEPYNKFIKDGVNGILINSNRNSIDWFCAMRRLIKEPELRKDLAAGLTETIKEHFDIDKHNERRYELYKTLV
ncbi:MAG: glycosyltransferase [Candidatus Berkelbacteria bacterium]|nr:glycosyltransferase [Candidatus Berkelbacteria bacterium]